MTEPTKNIQVRHRDDEEMLNYLSGNMSNEERDAFEMRIKEDDATWEAMQGLAAMGLYEVHTASKKVKANFSQTLEKRRRKARRARTDNLPMFWQVVLAIIFVLFIAAVVWWMVKS